MSLLGLVLLYVGAVLFINGLSLLGHIAAREAAVMNLFTGFVSVSASCYNAFVLADADSVKNAALGLLFGFTYLWVAYNSLTKADGRGLGWFSLFVAITAVPVFLSEWLAAATFGQKWLALNWLAWAVLWFSFFLLDARKHKNLAHPVGYLAIIQGVGTAWVPGFLLLMGKMPGIGG